MVVVVVVLPSSAAAAAAMLLAASYSAMHVSLSVLLCCFAFAAFISFSPLAFSLAEAATTTTATILSLYFAVHGVRARACLCA